MSYEPEMIPDMEHIDQRPSPIKKQKEKVTLISLINYYYIYQLNIVYRYIVCRFCMNLSCKFLIILIYINGYTIKENIFNFDLRSTLSNNQINTNNL